MSALTRRGRRTAVLCWLPVIALVGALFLVPGSTDAAGPRPLTVRPGTHTYGGQKVTFSGDLGSGEQRIFLQRRGSAGAAWAGVIDPRTGKAFSSWTEADGEFSFDFPAPAMNSVQFRVVSRQAETVAHTFRTVHQDADVATSEVAPAAVVLPRGIAVGGEGYYLDVDTVGKASLNKPALTGRVVSLQTRAYDNAWSTVETGQVGADGKVQFGSYVSGLDDDGVYRVVLDDWTRDGFTVGWFTSLPFYLHVVARPALVQSLGAAPTSSSVTLSWTPPASPVDRIVIARRGSGQPHPVRDRVASLAGTATSYLDALVLSGSHYEYAVYTVSSDGVYSRLSAGVSVDTPAARKGEG